MKYNQYRMSAASWLTLFAISIASHAMAQPPGGREGNDDRRGGPPRRFELGQVFPPPLLEELNLTPDQQKELDAIKVELKAKLEKLLTDEQKKTVENFRPRPPGGPGGPGRPGGQGGPDRPGGQGGPDRNGPPPPDSPRGGRGSDRPERPERPPGDNESQVQSGSGVQAKLKELPPGVTRVAVVFKDGHETDSRDGRRPVILIAAALGVTPEVFRDAFSKVRPARGGAEPEPAQVRQNKSVLMEALGKHSITNDQLDAVSNYYRFPPGRDSIWTNKPAVANALVKDGVIIGYEIVSGGSGYTSTPGISVPNIKGPPAKVELSYGKSFETNGSVLAISIPKDKAD